MLAGVGRMSPDESGTIWVSAVELSLVIAYAEGRGASPELKASLHH